MPAWLIPLISAGISFAGNLIGSKQQSNAAQKATEAEVTAQREALALQERIYNQTRGDLAPWVASGRNALSALSTLGGLPDPLAAGAGGALSGSTSGLATQGQPLTALRTGANFGAPAGNWPSVMGKWIPPTDQGGAAPPMTLAGLSQQGQSGYAPQGGGQTVLMRAPTGEVRPVPAHLAAHYQARGAQRVG